jgi:hypothetical protein
MRRYVWLMFATLAGCNSSGPSKLADNAVVAAVSADEKYLAYLTGPSLLADQGPTGSLSVAPVAGGAATKLGDGAFSATFNRSGDVLLFATAPTPSTDAGSKTIYGALALWTPSTTGAIKLTQGLAIDLAVPPDDSWVLFWDAPLPEKSQMGDVVLVRASECAGAACQPVTVAKGVECTFTTFSADGRFAAYVVKNGNKYETWLVDIMATGPPTMLASSLLGNSAAFSPDGSLVATGGTVMMGNVPLPLQLQVFSTGNAMPVPWAPQPAMTFSVELQFADSQTLIVRTSTAQMATAVYKTTASAATLLTQGAKEIYVQRVPAASSRWLFVSVNAMGTPPAAPFDWQVYDLESPTPAAVQLATAANLPVVSDDGTTVRFLESYDATALDGTLMVGALGAGPPSMVAANVPAASPQFESSTNAVLWLDSIMGQGTLSEWAAGKSKPIAKNVYDFRSRATPDEIYYAVTAADPISGAPSPGVYSVSGSPPQ